MELKKYKGIFSFLMLFLIIFSINNNNINDNIGDNTIPDNAVSQYNLDDIFTELIEIKHEKGNSLVNYKLHSYIYKSGSLQWGDYNLRINDISYIETAHNLSGISKGSFAGYAIDASLPWQNFINIASVPFYLSYFYGSKYESTSSFDIYDIWYPNNVDINPFLFTVKSPAFFSYVGLIEADSNYYIQESDSHYSRDRFILYHLEPVINIDSDFYNYQNTRLELKTYANVMVSGEYLSRSVSYEEKWIEMDYNDIILTHPIYSIRIFDLDNNLIYEENNINYSSYHECKIDSLKIQNNANEMINVSILESNHYKGAYSFDLEEVNTQPNDFIDSSGAGCLTYISDEIGLHNKVLTLSDESIIYGFGSILPITPLTSGVYSAYLRSSDTTYASYFRLEDGSGFNCVYIRINNEYLQRRDDSNFHNIIPVIDDTWYHLEINFTLSSYIIKVDGISYGSFETYGTPIEFDQLGLYSGSADNGFSFHVDAIDFSWSDGYYEGRNLEINNSLDLWNWNANPNWESGHYKESINWGNSSNPNLDDWSFSAIDRADIVDFEGHKDVLQVNETWGEYRYTQQEDGTVEWWWCQEELDVSYTYLRGDGNTQHGPVVLMDSGDWSIRTDAGGIVNIPGKTYNINQWYHCKIVFVQSTQKYDFYVDGVDFGEFDYRATVSNGLDTIRVFNTALSPFTKLANWDAIIFSWDDNYLAGMNTLENITASILPMEYYTTLVNPYSFVLTNYTQTYHLVNITDVYDNLIEYRNLSSLINEIIYTPPNTRNCLILLSDQLSNSLNYLNYHIYLNNSALYEQNFYREIDEIINISIYDRFDQYLTSQIYTIKRDDNFINIELILYSLKILNYLQEATILNITNQLNPGDCVLSENIAVNELISLNVKEANYSLYYTDDSGSEFTLNFTINESRLIILNTTYHQVHFSYFDLSGLGLDSDTARFYINNERRALGQNLVQGDTCNITVLDFFNATLYSEIISLVRLTEYNVYLPVYTMLINNNYSESMEISIKRSGIDIDFRQIIPSQTGFDIRLLANVEYIVKAYYINGTLAETKTILLNENYEKISFGFYSELIPITPEDIQIVLMDYVMLVMIAVIALTVIALMLIKKSKDLEEVPKTLRKPKRSNPNFRGKNDMDIFRP